MAVAPLNKFITVAVPVAPKSQKIYETKSGTSAILLYASVANVAGITTYPQVTFTHRRTSLARKTSGNERDIRVLKDVEIPPNDSLVIIDGRLVLERDATKIDSILVDGIQSGVVSVENVVYDNNTGIATITTLDYHNFAVGDEITLSNIRFTCTNESDGTPYTGITSSLFPNPQRSFTVESINNANPAISDEFTTNVGTIDGIVHTYAPADHIFIRSSPNSINVTSGTQNNSELTPVGASYNAANGDLTLTFSSNHNISTNDTISIDEESLTFKCSSDGYNDEIKYPRSTDPAGGTVNITVNDASGTSLTVNVGASPTSGYAAPLQMEFICSILENSTT
jgi:hypothetical protein